MKARHLVVDLARQVSKTVLGVMATVKDQRGRLELGRTLEIRLMKLEDRLEVKQTKRLTPVGMKVARERLMAMKIKQPALTLMKLMIKLTHKIHRQIVVNM